MSLDPGKKTQDITGLGKDRNEAANDHHGDVDSGNDGARPVRDRPARAERARVRFYARDRMASCRGPCGGLTWWLALGPYGAAQVANLARSSTEPAKGEVGSRIRPESW